MTQEEKDLLLKDLLPRLQYGVKIQTWYGETITSDINTFPIGYDEIDIEQLSGMKPYLRPLSSMTENEIRLFRKNSENEYRYAYEARANNEIRIEIIQRDCDAWTKDETWLNAHHFDYRGLIEKGLALQAPEGMYKFSDSATGNE